VYTLISTSNRLAEDNEERKIIIETEGDVFMTAELKHTYAINL
jgi:hypothetical protein